MKLRIHEFELSLKHPFAISRESYTSQPTVIVELEEAGHQGFGEATANRYYGVTSQGIVAALESVRDELEARQLEDPAELWDELREQLHGHPFAQCALDEAAHDLWGKKLGKPVYQLWGLTLDNLPPSNYTIGIDDIEVMVAKMRELPDWPVYKVKLGTDRDIEIVRALRQESNSPFRVDANCGWGLSETLENARQFQALNVEFIEQPLPADRWADMRTARAESALPLIADESCITPDDVERCADCFHGINIKLVKCGGLTPARRMIARARQLGLRVMVGCMTESTVGISAIAQLLPLLDYVDMDGALLLAEDVASGVALEQGYCRYPQENGTGVRLLNS